MGSSTTLETFQDSRKHCIDSQFEEGGAQLSKVVGMKEPFIGFCDRKCFGPLTSFGERNHVLLQAKPEN